MIGIVYDFDDGDVVIRDGSFLTNTIDNQNVALIAVSQVCRLLEPQIGAQITARITNRKTVSVPAVLADAVQQAKKDGARNVSIEIDESNQLLFRGTYAGR